MKWTSEDIRRVEVFDERDNSNHIPEYKNDAVNPTWHFYKRFIHILEGDVDFDFSDFSPEDIKEIDWPRIRSVLQKLKGEGPEEIEDQQFGEEDNSKYMNEVRDFLIENFDKDFDIPETPSICPPRKL